MIGILWNFLFKKLIFVYMIEKLKILHKCPLRPKRGRGRLTIQFFFDGSPDIYPKYFIDLAVAIIKSAVFQLVITLYIYVSI